MEIKLKEVLSINCRLENNHEWNFKYIFQTVKRGILKPSLSEFSVKPHSNLKGREIYVNILNIWIYSSLKWHKNAFQAHSIDVEASCKSSLWQSDQGNSWYFAEAWGINNRFRSPPMHLAKHVTNDISYLMKNSIQKTVTLDKKTYL